MSASLSCSASFFLGLRPPFDCKSTLIFVKSKLSAGSDSISISSCLVNSASLQIMTKSFVPSIQPSPFFIASQRSLLPLKTICSRDAHPLNACFPIDVISYGKITSSSDEQPSKALSPITVALLERLTVLMVSLPANADLPTA